MLAKLKDWFSDDFNDWFMDHWKVILAIEVLMLVALVGWCWWINFRSKQLEKQIAAIKAARNK